MTKRQEPDPMDYLAQNMHITELQTQLAATKEKLARAEAVVKAYIEFEEYTDNMADDEGNMDCEAWEKSTELEIALKEAIKAYREVGSE